MKRSYLVGALLAVSTLPALAAWPDDQPIEIVVGFSPGGGTDLLARVLAPYFKTHLGEKANVVVINKPGAAGEIATTYVARAKPDGYTIGIVNVPGYVFTPMYKSTSYQTDDLRLVGRIVDDPTLLVAKNDSPYNNLASVIQGLKTKPDSLSFGYSGAGTNGHLALLQIQKAGDVKPNDIPFKGAAEIKTALLGGHIDFGFVSVAEMPELTSGKSNLKAVSQMREQPFASLRSVPTSYSEGYKIAMSSERGMAVPKAVPEAIFKRLEAALKEAIADPGFVKAAVNDAPTLAYLSGADWTRSLETNRKLLAPLVGDMPKQ